MVAVDGLLCARFEKFWGMNSEEEPVQVGICALSLLTLAGRLLEIG